MISRILFSVLQRMIIHLGNPLPDSSISDLPGNHYETGSLKIALFDLAPCGVYPASSVTGEAVRSYRTFSPLPLLRVATAYMQRQVQAGRCIFCGTFPGITPGPR